MRLLVVSQYFYPENFRINELVWGLKNKGVSVDVLTSKPNYPGGIIYEGYRAWGCVTEQLNGVKIYRVPLIPRGKGPWYLVLNYLSFIVSASALGPWLLRKRCFDAIFVFAPSPILQAIPAISLGWIKNCPVLLWVQDLWPESLSATGYVKHPYLLRLVESVVKWIYRNVDLLLVQSRAFISKILPIASATPIVYYPNSFIERVPNKLYMNMNCSGFDCEFPVLYAGNLGSAQAVDVVLKAAKILRGIEGIRFLIIGNGSRRDWMMQQAEEQDLKNLVFPGSYPVEEMPALLQRASALLVTLADTEILRLTIPSKVQAYLAAGRPIIACLNGAAAELIQEAGAGMTVPAEDALALSQAVMTIYTMTESERLQMGASGRRFYKEHFSHDKLVDKLIEHLDQVVHNRKALVS